MLIMDARSEADLAVNVPPKCTTQTSIKLLEIDEGYNRYIIPEIKITKEQGLSAPVGFPTEGVRDGYAI